MEKKFLSLVKNSVADNWERPALSNFEGSTYYYKDFAKEMAKLHLLFAEIGIQKGDKVALCAPNSAQWAIAFFGSMSYGAALVTILHDFNAQSIENITNHSEAKVLFVDSAIWKKLNSANMPLLHTILQMEDFAILQSESETIMQDQFDLEAEFNNKYADGFGKNSLCFHEEQPEDLAILNYTSGTTSKPKGVMISYRSVWSNTRFAIDNITFVKTGDSFVSMLPMAHMYGLAFDTLLAITKGCHLHFLTKAPSPQVIVTAFSKAKPTLLLAVPLIIEKIIRSRVFPELQKQPVKTLLKIPGIRNIVYKKVCAQILDVFGGNILEVVIGGAAFNKEIGDFLSKIKFPYTVGYGMTECGPLISYDYWDTYRATSCGKVVDRMEIKIDSEDPEKIAGEILVKGANVMLGYYKDAEATELAFDAEGWLKTGDLGVLDNAGYLYIRGRNKTMILGASGQNIYPEEIEDLLNNLPVVSESLVIEEKNKLVALIYPDAEYLKTNNISADKLNSTLTKNLKSVNTDLPNYSQLVRFTIQDKEFEKTPKRSIKRFLYQTNN